MKRIFIAYPDKHFLSFIKQFLSNNEFQVDYTHTGGLIFNKCLKFQPNLIICNKILPSLDLKGFFVRKKMTSNLKKASVFLIGDFMATELLEYKKEKVKAFISSPINPHALLERIKIHFEIPSVTQKMKTPMLVDIHVKSKIITVQIEGNFDRNKIILLNYKIRCYCHEKKIDDPRILFVFPSFYPETITKENMHLLFSFLNFPELEIKSNQIKILTNVKPMVDFFKYEEEFQQYELVPDYIYGIRTLNIDFDNSKKIPVSFLKDGASYILDLYDKEGMVRIPAYTKITQQMVDYLIKMGESSLTYYSDQSITDISGDTHISSMDNFAKIEATMAEYEEIDKYSNIVDLKNEKINLFLSKLRGQGALIISESSNDFEVLNNAVGDYLHLTRLNNGQNILDFLNQKKQILIFLDFDIINPTALEVLQIIRTKFTRRQITVIIITKKIDRITLTKFKKSGTDYIIISPFSTAKILPKIFHYISTDRKT